MDKEEALPTFSGEGSFDLLLDIAQERAMITNDTSINPSIMSSGGTGGTGTGGTPGVPPTPTTTSYLFVPTTPIMGEVVRAEKGLMAFCGGPPLADLSGLDPTAPTEPLVAYQLRSLNESKNYLLRVTGMEVKYKHKGSDFSELQDGMLDHFEKHGLDSIAHLQNPLDATKTIVWSQKHVPLR